MPVNVVPKLHDDDEELIRKCAIELVFRDSHRRPRTRCDVYVRPLGRRGYTDSRLYRVAFNHERSRPFVIKTDVHSEMEREAEGITKARNLKGTESAERYPSDGVCEAIMYPLISQSGGVDDITELADLMYASQRSRLPRRAASVRTLASLYDTIGAGNPSVPSTIVYGQEYRRYLRERSRSRKLLNPLSDFFPNDRSESRHGRLVLRNPRRILERVKAQQVESIVRHVHGDLHPKNVLIDDRRHPNMIDFAYGDDRGHWIKDFVLMECSVRFVEPPRLLDADALREADAALLQEHGTHRVRAIAEGTSTRTGAVLREMADLVETIRARCRTCHPDYDFEEYLTATYLILMGCIRLVSYQDLRVMLALCELADHLEPRLA